MAAGEDGRLDGPLADLVELADDLRVPVKQVSRTKLDAAARTDAPQGVVAYAAPAARGRPRRPRRTTGPDGRRRSSSPSTASPTPATSAPSCARPSAPAPPASCCPATAPST